MEEKMERKVGTVSRGIRCPIIRQGDDLAKIVVDSVLEAAQAEGFEIRDRDVIAVTESVVARSQGNYASVEAIAQDVKNKLGGETIGVIFPILSRNRFAICLRGIAMGAKKVVLMLMNWFHWISWTRPGSIRTAMCSRWKNTENFLVRTNIRLREWTMWLTMEI